jgi:hypothetical protein
MSFEQAVEELGAFQRAMQCLPLAIDASSIRSRRPPEPDILCTTAQGVEVAFELVEIVDPAWARSTGDQWAVDPLFQDALSTRAQYDQSFAHRYRNAIVAIRFANFGTRRQAAAIPAVVDLLSSLPVAFEGAVTREALTPDLAELRVSRVATTQGPVGCVLAVASVDQPIIRQLEFKWRKTYETSRPVELLAYFGVQPVGALDSWLPAVQEFAEQNWASSPFQRVWVCDLSVPSVIWLAERRAA